MRTVDEMIERMKNVYGYDFPKYGTYKRNKNRIYFSGDFEDGERIEYWYSPDKPSACVNGLSFYKSCNSSKTMLISIEEIKSD